MTSVELVGRKKMVTGIKRKLRKWLKKERKNYLKNYEKGASCQNTLALKEDFIRHLNNELEDFSKPTKTV